MIGSFSGLSSTCRRAAAQAARARCISTSILPEQAFASNLGPNRPSLPYSRLISLQQLPHPTCRRCLATDQEILASFANLDHSRYGRTGVPEAVFAAGKTADQVARILDDMARSLNEKIDDCRKTSELLLPGQAAILATRVTPEEYEKIKSIPLQNGTITYHETARIISMRASNMEDNSASFIAPDPTFGRRVVVATAGTTDLYVAEEAAVTLEAAGCQVDRINDVGVAGLHRIINALPKLRHPDVGCVIVCAGMDGALPSVVGGLVSVPVYAVPTSIGYGISLQGISAMLTMLNSCAPGVGVVNIDNGFGAAALAYKTLMVGSSRSSNTGTKQ